MSEETDSVYRERDFCVAAFARMAYYHSWYCGLAQHDPSDASWEDEWRTIVYIDLPRVGQVSWHIHKSEISLFAYLPRYDGKWDGHSTEEKYRRIADLVENWY